MTIIGDRLREAMTQRKVEQDQLANAVGCTQGAISHILNGHTLRSRFLPEIADYLKVPLGWLRGDLDDYPHTSVQPEQTSVPMVQIAMVDMAYGMGATFAGDSVAVDLIDFPKLWVDQLTHSAAVNLAWARGKGDSMAPTINDGDMVLIDRTERRVEDQDLIWAFTIGDMAMIKRLRIRGDEVTIMSDNASVRPATAHPEEINIIGRITRVVKPV
jgi:phage repressor protein C with HTH and peptisase S24 domain/DNA-binding Xre family transcriptional regulator